MRTRSLSWLYPLLQAAFLGAALPSCGGAPADGTCGGKVPSEGNTPVGPFNATKVRMVRDDDFSRLQVGLYEEAFGTSFTFTIPIDRALNGGVWLGSRSVDGSYGPPPTAVSLALDISTAEDLLGENHVRPWGRVAAEFSATTGGLEVRGMFDSPVCKVIGTF